MKMRSSRLTALAVPVLVLVGMLMPGSASADPKCQKDYMLRLSLVDSPYSAFDRDGNELVCVKVGSHGGGPAIKDDAGH